MPDFEAIIGFLLEPLGAAAWGDGREFWLRQVADNRLLIVWFLPAAVALALCPARALRPVIVATGLLFVGYLFGALYAAAWLLSAIGFFYFAQGYAGECRRSDVLPIGPPLAALGVTLVWFYGLQAVGRVELPAAFQQWLAEVAPWCFPLGLRGWAWEPEFLDGPRTPLLGAILFDPHLIGSAYLIVRMLHYFAEIKRGTLPPEERRLADFLAWVCYGGNLMQGPIERYPAFIAALRSAPSQRRLRHVPAAFARIALGIGKSVITTLYFVPTLHQLGYDANGLYYGRPQEITSYALLYFGVFLQIFSLYLEFSGYCDISAGCARLWGYRQIENFQMPWLATSLRDFWRRWHISLSAILRDYIYIPLGGNRRHVTLNLCLTFAICGIWHRPLLQLALWGVVMGLMLSLNQHWANWMNRLDAAPAGAAAALRRAWLRLWPLPQVCAWLITQHAFVFSLLIFFGGRGGWRVFWELIRRPLGW